MPFVTLSNDNRIYYELTGPEDGPVVLQFGGSLFGRHNFGFVNDGFRERGFRLLSYDATGYGRSDCPKEPYSVEGWADEGALLLDALGLESPPAPTAAWPAATSTAGSTSAPGARWPRRCRSTTSAT